jgi:hypothetical protein
LYAFARGSSGYDSCRTRPLIAQSAIADTTAWPTVFSLLVERGRLLRLLTSAGIMSNGRLDKIDRQRDAASAKTLKLMERASELSWWVLGEAITARMMANYIGAVDQPARERPPWRRCASFHTWLNQAFVDTFPRPWETTCR